MVPVLLMAVGWGEFDLEVYADLLLSLIRIAFISWATTSFTSLSRWCFLVFDLPLRSLIAWCMLCGGRPLSGL